MRGNSLIEGQLRGAIIIVALAFVVLSARWAFQYFQLSGDDSTFEYGDRGKGPLVVEISGDSEVSGIYYLPEGMKLSDLLDNVGINDEKGLKMKGRDLPLSTGDKIVFDGSSLRIQKMDAPTRLALEMPLNINEATVEDLILIPGIGLKTATAIVDLRQRRGHLSSIEDIKGVGVVGKKKYEEIKNYLAVE